MKKIINFLGWNGTIEEGRYSNDRISLTLIDTEDGVPIAVCTVNLPDEILEADEVCIKDYSENSGLLNILVNEDIVYPANRYTMSGYVIIPICKLKNYK